MRLVFWAAIASLPLFILSAALNSRVIGLIAVACLIPLAFVTLSAFFWQLINFILSLRKRG